MIDPLGDCTTCPTAIPLTAYEVGVALVESYEAYQALKTLDAVMQAGDDKWKLKENEEWAKNPTAYIIGQYDITQIQDLKVSDPLMYNAWTLHKYKGIPMYRAIELLKKAEAQKVSVDAMASKKGPKG